MAATIQLATTLVASTGTGVLFTHVGPTKASVGNVFLQSGATGLPRRIELKRTEPKPTSTFPGTKRSALKYVHPVTVGSNNRDVLIEATFAAAADVPQADIDAAVVQFQLALTHAVGGSSLKTQSIEV